MKPSLSPRQAILNIWWRGGLTAQSKFSSCPNTAARKKERKHIVQTNSKVMLHIITNLWVVSVDLSTLSISLTFSKLSWKQSKNIFPLTALFKKTRTLKLKSRLHTAFFASVNHNYDHKQRTLEHRNTKWIEICRSQTMTFSIRWGNLLFPMRSA